MTNNIEFYNNNAETLSEQYNSLDFKTVHKSWIEQLPAKGNILDVGSGSGRDVNYFAEHGFKVVAVEPAKHLLAQAKANYPNKNIIWIEDCLPNLKLVENIETQFDLILISAVWMHLPEDIQFQSLQALKDFLKPNGKLIITLRIGAFTDGREAHPISVELLKKQTEQLQLKLTQLDDTQDELKRADVYWQTVMIENNN